MSTSATNNNNNNNMFQWNDQREEAMAKCVMPLSSQSHKGSSGRVGVLGGSARYTGAPYYAAMASLMVGADLAFVFCAEEAALPIKSYSPELMVAPVYKAQTFDELVSTNATDTLQAKQGVDQMVHEVEQMMDKLHVLVIGPGLGRCPLVFQATARIIQIALEKQIPLVLDADALYMLTLEPYQNVLFLSSINKTTPVVLTPNVMELRRLEEGLPNDFRKHNNNNSNLILVEKGHHDVITSTRQNDTTNTTTTLTCAEVGGLKRSGGLGDVLAGTLGTLVAWNAILQKQTSTAIPKNDNNDDLPLSCWTACCIVKRATKHAFDQHGRSMTAPNVLQSLGPVIRDMFSE